MRTAFHSILRVAALVAALGVVRAPAVERPQPPILQRAGFDTRLGAQVPLDLVFRDEEGKDVRLRDLVQGRPVILNLAYFECPMLCTLVINGLVDCMKALPFEAGRDMTVLTVSFNHRETSELARKKKANYLESLGRPAAAKGWHFLTGDESAITQLTASVGFRFAYDEAAKEYAHGSGIVLLTPDGRISHYFYGVQYVPEDVRLGLVDASEGTIGTWADRITLFCYHFDATTGKYSLELMRFVQLGCLLTVAALGAYILTMVRRERRTAAAGGVG